ncbi:MAG TPA: FAD-binding oxidoreductase [Acidimicrobiia bacterium]|nr:FAD-binding oxidoreductase [Acidimicrobiia bacterium]
MRAVVVGGGIAGASAGMFLAEAGVDVVLLEQEIVCGHHTTGRSAALFTEAYAQPALRRLAIGSRRFLEHPPDEFADAPIVSPLGGLLFAARDDQQRALDREYRLAAEHVPSVRLVDREEALSLCPVLDPDVITGGYLEPDAMNIDVHALHQGYLGRLRRHDGRIEVRSPVTGLAQRGTTWHVTTPSGSLETDVVVNAAGAWCDRVAGLAGIEPLGLRPLRRTAFTIDLDRSTRGWSMVVDVDEQWYLKPEGAGLLCSPADEWDSVPCDARHREEDVALGIERINAATTLAIRSIRSAWAGLRSFLPDRVPAAGEDPDHPGFFWLAGQGGSGIKTSPALGMLTADLVTSGRPREDLIAAGVDVAELAPARFRDRS